MKNEHGVFAALLIALCLWAAPPAHADEAYVRIEQRLTAEQLRATGLDRLTSDELALLNRLLREERAEAEQASAVANLGLRRPRASQGEDTAPLQVESTIQGEFRGWSPGTTFTLANGQRWRVVDGSLHARRTDSPKATVSRSAMGAWFLKVDGHNTRAKVSRID